MRVMRLAFPALMICRTLVACATEQTVSGLPESPFTDTEVSTDVVFSAGRAEARTFRMSLELTATTNNCLAVAFGVDANGNGVLDHAEVDVVWGWDCGEWFWRDRRSGQGSRLSRDGGPSRIDVRMELDPFRRAKSVQASDPGGAVFSGTVPATLFDPEWNLMRVTARGSTAPDGIVVSGTEVHGLKVVVR